MSRSTLQRLAGHPLLHVWALMAFAVAQPLSSLLADNTPFLVFHQIGLPAFALLVAVLWLALPAVPVLTALGLRRLSPRLGHRATGLLLFSGFLAWALVGLNRLAAPPAAIGLALAGLAAVLAMVLYRRSLLFRCYLTVLFPAACLLLAAFLLDPRVRRAVAAPASPEEVELPASPAQEVPVVLVIFDGMPLVSLLDEGLGIDASLAPHFAALAATSIWYRNATTVHWFTAPSITAILTGTRVLDDDAPTSASYPRNLFSLLGGSHRILSEERVTRLAPRPDVLVDRKGPRGLAGLGPDLWWIYLHLLAPGTLRDLLPSIDDAWGDFAARGDGAAREKTSLDPREEQFRAFLHGIRGGERPGLFFAHVGIPHLPWRYLPSGRQYAGLPGWIADSFNPWLEHPRYAELGYQRHMLQLQRVDALLGELTDRLRAERLWDASLVIVTSDHGASHWPGESRRDPLSMKHPLDVFQVPLFVKLPHQEEGRIVDLSAESIDILPTIAQVLGTEVPWPIDGTSLLAEEAEHRSEKLAVRPGHGRSSPALDHRFGASWDPDRESLERKLSLFPTSADPYRFFSTGPHRDLAGREVSELEVAGRTTCKATLGPAELFAEPDPDSAVVPALVWGRITDPAVRGEDPSEIAVAVSGRIEAIGAAIAASENEAHFGLLVPEAPLLAPGRRIDLFLVEGAADLRLVPCPATPALEAGPDTTTSRRPRKPSEARKSPSRPGR